MTLRVEELESRGPVWRDPQTDSWPPGDVQQFQCRGVVTPLPEKQPRGCAGSLPQLYSTLIGTVVALKVPEADRLIALNLVPRQLAEVALAAVVTEHESTHLLTTVIEDVLDA